MSQVPEDDLQKIVTAYDNGEGSVFINGERRSLYELVKIKVFTYNDSWDTWNAFVNSVEVKPYYEFSSLTGKIAIGIPALAMKGTDVTKDYFNRDYGWKKKSDSENIFMLKKQYISHERIEYLKTVKSEKHDFRKLIRICEEINITYNLDCFYAVGGMLRSLIDHVAPIFGYTNFGEVTNNYNGGKSFKEAMQQLEKSMRKISDSFLHTSIRSSEVLPVANQVEFIAPIDLLLSEIIRITESKTK
ncbi:hypothetical protein [Aquirufa salirivi]